MSFILDALKKSETDRQQRGGAEFSAVPAGTAAPRAPRWIWPLVALLGVNLIVVLWLVLAPDSPPPQPALAAASPAPTTAQVAAPSPSFEQRVAEARASQPPAAAEPEAPGQAQAQTPIRTTSSRPAAGNALPSALDLRLAGELPIPELHVDIHVFSDVPSDRFVFINMVKHREGSTLSEGPRLVEITVDGVVLEYEGRRFTLPRE